MAARTPPPDFSVRQFPSPNVLTDQVVLVSVTTELANSNPIEPGTPHPDLRNFPGYKLGCTRVNPSDPYFSERIYVSDQTNADWYSYALKYVSEANSCPIFIRGYQERKDTYAPRTKNSALQVVYKLALTGAGSGYTPGTQPALTFSGGAGTGAAGHAIVSPLGSIAQLVLTAGGSGYTSAPTFTVAAPPSGTTATGTAFIQPTGAVLVSEEAQLYPPDSEFYALYWNVIRVYKTMPGPALTLKSVGSVDHTPNKYKRFVKRTSTVTDPVAPSTALPTLTGTQSYAEVKQNSVAEAAQTIETLEIDVSAEPLVGQQTGEFGIETIEESYVADGTDAESGFGVKESSVEPDGTGNSEKRTVRYPDPGVAEVLITTPGTGYTNGIYALGFTGGTGSGAAGTYTVEGTVVARAKITAPGIYTALPTPTFPSGGGSGAVGLAIEGHPAKISRLFDEEMLVTYPRSEQIIAVITDAQAALLQVQAQPGEMKELIGIDVWHSRLIKETKTPTAVDEASSIQSTKTRPYSFPGLLPSTPAITSGSNFVLFPFSFRKTTAQLVQANVKTWWVISTTKPSIAIDQVITDTVFVFTMEDSAATLIGRRYEGVLHDAMTTTYFAGSVGVSNSYNATTPSYTTYTGSWIGAEKVVAASVDPTKQKNLWKVQIEKVVMR